MQKHALYTLFGLVLAALAVAWIEPNTNGGTTFLVVIVVLFTNAIGGIATRFRTKKKDATKLPVAAPATPRTEKLKGPGQ